MCSLALTFEYTLQTVEKVRVCGTEMMLVTVNGD